MKPSYFLNETTLWLTLCRSWSVLTLLGWSSGEARKEAGAAALVSSWNLTSELEPGSAEDSFQRCGWCPSRCALLFRYNHSVLRAGRPCRCHRRSCTSPGCWASDVLGLALPSGCVSWHDAADGSAPLPLRDSCFKAFKNVPEWCLHLDTLNWRKPLKCL